MFNNINNQQDRPLLLDNDYNQSLEKKEISTKTHKTSSIKSSNIKLRFRNIFKSIGNDNSNNLKYSYDYKSLFTSLSKIELDLNSTLEQKKNSIDSFIIHKIDKHDNQVAVAVAILPNDLLFKLNNTTYHNNDTDKFNEIKKHCSLIFNCIPKKHTDFFGKSTKYNITQVDECITSIKSKIQNIENSSVYINSSDLELVSPIISQFTDLGYNTFCFHSKINILKYGSRNNIIQQLTTSSSSSKSSCNFNIDLSEYDKSNSNATFFNVPQ